jgi:hypothetical protein
MTARFEASAAREKASRRSADSRLASMTVVKNAGPQAASAARTAMPQTMVARRGAVTTPILRERSTGDPEELLRIRPSTSSEHREPVEGGVFRDFSGTPQPDLRLSRLPWW